MDSAWLLLLTTDQLRAIIHAAALAAAPETASIFVQYGSGTG